MKRVGKKYNSHVVSMICCIVNQEPRALVLEYVEYGDLLQYLQKNKVFVSIKFCMHVCECSMYFLKLYSTLLTRTSLYMKTISSVVYRL